MKRIQILVLASVALALTTKAVAFDLDEARARYTVTSWTEKDGLPSSYVRAIVQDRDGYLWLATYSGLVRFDGVRFVAWKAPDGASLASDDLASLLVAHDGSLWVGSFGGVTHLVGGRIVAGASPPKGLFDGYVSELLEDKDGVLWAAGQDGVARFDGTHWEKIGTRQGLPERPVISFFQDNRGVYWVGTSAGIYRKTPQDATFKAFAPLSDAIESVIQNAHGNIVVTHPTHLMSELLGSAQSPENLALERSHGTRLLLDREGSVWVGTRSQGLFRIRDGGRGGHLIDRVTRDDGLSADSVQALMQDREGNIWVGTPFGLNRLSENAIIPVPPDQGLSGFVRAVASSAGGSIWAATEDSLVHFSGQTQRRYDWNGILPNRTLIALHEDRTGTLWISTNQGLVRLAADQFSAFNMPGNLALNRIRSIASDADGRLWLCDADRGVFRSTDRSLTAFDLIIPNKPASWVYSAHDGRVWIGLVNGTVGSYKDGALELFSESDGLPGGAVTAIHEDRSGIIWVGTYRGLSRFEDHRFATLTRNQGFPGTGPVVIADDDEGYLWLGVTGLGMLRLARTDFDDAVRNHSHRLQYRLYGASEGLRATPARQFGTPSSARAANGAIWFLTGNGLAVVDPSRLRGSRPTVPLLIEGMLADNQRFTGAMGDLKLPPNTSTLQIDYTLLSLSPQSQTSFRYKLEGFDQDWVDAETRRQAFYTNVPPGNYRFVVDVYGGERSAGSAASWRFAIQPRFYQTQLFALASTLIGVMGLWGLWQLRLRQIRRRFAVVLNERARMGREIHDTLLQGLVGVAMQFKVISDHLHSSPDMAKERLDRLRKLVEHYICETRQSIWDLRSPMLEVYDLVTALKTSGETLTADKPVQFELAVSGKPYPCPPKTEEQLLRVAHEALTNAVRHANPSRVRVELDYGENDVRLRVVDDGHGFDVDAAVSSHSNHWGLMSMRERAELVNGQLDLASTPGQGTRLELVVPSLATR